MPSNAPRWRCLAPTARGQLQPFHRWGGQLRRVAVLTQGPPPPGGGSAGSSGGAQTQTGGSMLRRGLVVVVKGCVIWLPAILFWVSLVWGGAVFDYRTQEEIEEDEAEVRRLERFFDVERLADDDYLAEWTAKDEALSKIVDKLLRAAHFTDCMVTGGSAEAPQASASEANSIEVSYVLPPVAALGDGEAEGMDGPGPRPWYPRLIVAHRLGSLALVCVSFEHVPGSKDREERWACTSLRTDLITLPNGEAVCEPICDLRGPVPHGVRYYRIEKPREHPRM